jgi:uroporphyrin-III C-methyltransferase/precorrin-2 dehydrogenase/sirohydrochlorin ferrochelatase
MNLLPIFLNLADRNCLIVGAGNIALDKIETLLPTGLKLRVVAPTARAEVRELADAHRLEWLERAFTLEDLGGQFLVIAATDRPEINAAVYRACTERNIPCNSVDDIPNCDFFFGSVVRRGPLQIAISTSGESPAVAQRLRREIEEQLPGDIGPWLESLGDLRREVLAMQPRGEGRKLLLHRLAQRQICESTSCPSRQLASASALESRGTVFLVGAGPGDPDLLTIKALRLLQTGDVVLHDDLVPQAILNLASSHAEIVNVGKRCGAKSISQQEINALMIAHAREHRNVIRLKSGDPLVFGRATEEIAALVNAGVAFEVVPGITAAFAAAAQLGCSLTDREGASNVTFSTGHHADAHNRSSLPAIEASTRVVYMPGRDLGLLAAEWLQQGLPSDFPCAVISRAGQAGEQVQCTTLGALGALASVPAPSLLIGGWTLRNARAFLGSLAEDVPVQV